jgi:hypothetical protein
MSPEEMRGLVQRAGELLDRLGASCGERRPAVWAVEREGILEQVRRLLRHERAEHAEARPEAFEYEFRHAPRALEEEVEFEGRIDRIDRSEGGGIVVVDYKTGRSANYKKNSLAGGTQLQLPVYLLCATELMEAGAGRALYLHVPGPQDVPEFDLDGLRGRLEDFRRALELIRDGIGEGDFFPLPAADRRSTYRCGSYCPYAHVCGAAREKLAEIKETDPDADRLRRLRAIR